MAVIGQDDVAVPRRRGAQAIVEPDVIPEGERRARTSSPPPDRAGPHRSPHPAGRTAEPLAAVLVLHHHALEGVRGASEQAESGAAHHAAPAEAVPGGTVAVPDAQIIGRIRCTSGRLARPTRSFFTSCLSMGGK